jgi:uncharacterized membrane protein YfcA
METLFPLMIIVFFSNLTEACAGFGATILAIIFGARFFAIEDLIPMLVPLNLLLSLVIVVRYFGDIDRRALLTKILPITGIGMPIGIAIFQSAPSRTLKIAFGVIVVILGLFELSSDALARLKGRKVAQKKLPFWQGALFLLGGGIMQGLYASGGPFVVYFASREITDKKRFRTTLALLWLILNLVLTSSLFFSGKITRFTLQYSLYLLPAVLLGMWVGIKVHDRVSESTFRRIVYALLVLAGSSLAYRTAITGSV